jgi:hypothetical protein
LDADSGFDCCGFRSLRRVDELTTSPKQVTADFKLGRQRRRSTHYPQKRFDSFVSLIERAILPIVSQVEIRAICPLGIIGLSAHEILYSKDNDYHHPTYSEQPKVRPSSEPKPTMLSTSVRMFELEAFALKAGD